MAKTIMLALAALSTTAAPAATPAAPALSDAERAAAFTAAGFHHDKSGWHACGDPGDAGSYTPGSIDQVADLNGDGRPEAVISEGSGYCFGNTGVGYSIVSQQPGGGWKLIDADAGVPEFLATKGKDGWPDLEVGGPGFCFPVLRWNGTKYVQNRFEYEGKACRP